MSKCRRRRRRRRCDENYTQLSVCLFRRHTSCECKTWNYAAFDTVSFSLTHRLYCCSSVHTNLYVGLVAVTM